ncbi:hypothetical protein G5B88_04425 [Herbaspirillum seropedicae]|uniref:Uncharacterized protein n=1 Tax=Herbaspirillum seropedicae (strain SmR1) TaxID=757424 RepID=D8J057_HERSS|nr:hypothetical protein [Herbaspirillum seropedicae]ADJ62394.1 hypothetical protein Hsero_0877 [Herbaspirillum seropedicae SmR1]AKN64525.1 hypothetical protein ACP92_04385 [Herbaspirillum seropedicae]UMU20463.1 hypothetical protein G5B88_04425 [Herbaspirillum seropedicae]
MNIPAKFDLIAPDSKSRDFVMQPPQSLDRITFNTPDDGVLAGYVSVIRQHLGNGERFAWVELDNALPGSFRGVSLADILSSDDCGSVRRHAELNRGDRSLCLADFSNVFVEVAGPIFEGNADAECES